MDLEIIKREFNKYVKQYDNNHFDINYKFKHSYRVMELSNNIASSLNLDSEDILLASVIGLLHDIGRFKQIEIYNSYDDNNMDHAEYGAKILFDDKLIENFKINKKYYPIIEFAIRNHNKYKIEESTDPKKILYAKIVRDADKLDILNVFSKYKDYKLKESSNAISKNVVESFYKNESVSIKDNVDVNDKVILTLSFIFDLNFDYSLDYVKKNKLIENLYDVIEHKDIFEPYFKYIIDYINERNE